MKIKSSLCWTLALAGAALPFGAPAHAQNAVTPGIGGRLSVVELRDTSLSDALEMIFQAAGNPSHIIDEQAQTVPIAAITLNNIAWDAAVRNLTQLNGYKVSRNASGTYLIEPRVIAPVDGGFFPGGEGAPFGAPGSPFPGGAPSNPFVRNRFGGNNSRTQANPDLRPRTQANSQTRPNFGGRGGGNTADPSKEGKDYKIIIVRHIYAGGLAQLFANADVIHTEDFVSPGQFGGGQGGQGGGGQGGGGFGGGQGGGGFGGGQGGQSGFGGGGSGGGSSGGGSFGGGIGGTSGGGDTGGGGGFGGGLGF